MANVVIYRLGSLGDTIVALPFFNRVAALYPDHTRIVLTNVPVSSKAAPLLSVLGTGKTVHRAMSYPVGLRSPSALLALRRELAALQAEDLIYIMPARKPAAAFRDYLFLKACGFRRIIGVPLSSDLREPRRDADGMEEPEVERLARTLAALGPIDLQDPANWDLRLDPDEITAGQAIIAPLGGRPYLAINMGGKAREKDWGEANWMALLDRLSADFSDWGLLVIGAEEDAGRAASATARWQGPVVNACGKLNARQSAAAMAKAAAFIGHDSGPLHLASAVGVRCVGLFGDFNRPRRWHPYLGDNRILHDMRGVAAISVDQVAGAVLELSQAGAMAS